MKTSRQFCATFILTLVLAFSTFAGEIGFPGATNPAPPPQQQASITGDTQFSGATSAGDMSGISMTALDPVTEATLSLLQSLILLF